jgi:TolB-like protein
VTREFDATLELLQSALPERYRVLREIGRGGMATVYLAEDIPHARNVAVKVLSGELGSSMDGARFEREIQIAAGMSHPNILPAYDSGSSNGIHFYVMPFIEGESVRARLDRESQLPIEDAIAITCEVLDALTYAHARGIVHRDIKPENILLQSGHAVVADFGIARLIQEGGATLTQTGMSLGTAQYMSPEQASAEKVDGRSDLYAVACVLYEMLIGEPPFTGPNAMAVLARAITQPVPSVRVVRSSVPESIEFAIMRAMEKVPVDRFATAEEFKVALLEGEDMAAVTRHTRAYTQAYRSGRRNTSPWRRPRVLALATALGVVLVASVSAWMAYRAHRVTALAADDATLKRIGVMYFDDASPDGSLRALADGLTESLIDELDRVPTLDIMSRSAVRPFRGLAFSSDSVHNALKVGTIVRGEVGPGARMPQVTVRLLDAASGVENANAKFDFDTANALAARTDLTKRVAEFLREKVGLDVELKGSRLRASDPRAWTMVQRAEKQIKDADSLIVARQPVAAMSAIASAESELSRATTLDPAWAQPWISRAAAAHERARAQRDRPAVANAALDSGRVYIDRALAIDPLSADAHELSGRLAYAHVELRTIPEGSEWDAQLTLGEKELREAVRLNPQQATAYEVLSNLSYAKKSVPEGLQAAMNAYTADAYLLNARGILGRLFWGNFDSENFPEARRWCDEGHRRFPREIRFVQCSLYLMNIKGATPDPDEAWRMADTIHALSTPATAAYEDHFARTLVGGVLGKAGLKDSANHVLIAARAGRDVDPTQEIIGREIMMRLMYGDYETAITRLGDYLLLHPDHRKGLANQTAWYYRDPKVQGDPRFKKLIAGAR